MGPNEDKEKTTKKLLWVWEDGEGEGDLDLLVVDE